jgi:hypothetical protein
MGANADFRQARRSAGTQLCSIAIISMLLTPCVASAQWRPRQPDVVEPRPRAIYERPDYAGAFERDYDAAGRPALMLFWNIAFDDNTEMHSEDREITNERSASDYSSFEEVTAGEAGSAKLTEGDENASASTAKIRTRHLSDPSKRATNLSERNTAELETAFLQTMRSGGVNFVDRGTAIRISSLQRAGADRKIVETEALVSSAAMILEILMIPDDSAPIGWSFRVAVRTTNTSTEILSFFTSAAPVLPPIQGRYVATDRGYEWLQPQRGATTSDVGIQLANELMMKLGPLLGRARK